MQQLPRTSYQCPETTEAAKPASGFVAQVLPGSTSTTIICPEVWARPRSKSTNRKSNAARVSVRPRIASLRDHERWQIYGVPPGANAARLVATFRGHVVARGDGWRSFVRGAIPGAALPHLFWDQRCPASDSSPTTHSRRQRMRRPVRRAQCGARCARLPPPLQREFCNGEAPAPTGDPNILGVYPHPGLDGNRLGRDLVHRPYLALYRQ